MTSFYNTHPDLRDEPEGGYLQFVRWEEFWRNRVYGKDTTRYGSLDHWLLGIENFDQSRDQFSSTSIGSSWEVLGPVGITYQRNGLVSAVYVDTITDNTMNTIYIGTNASGIWKTTDGGQNWINLLDDTSYPNLGILDITGNPYNENIIYVASGGSWTDRPDYPSGRYGIGILKSTTGGESWTTIWDASPSDKRQVFKLLVDPHNTNRLYALVDSCVLRTQDGGSTWDTIFNSLEDYDDLLDNKYLKDIEMKPGDSNTLYIASDDNNGWQNTCVAEIWKTSNATSASPSWTRLDTLLLQPCCPIGSTPRRTTEQYEIAVSPADPNAVWVMCSRFLKDTIMIWKSMDSGNSWNLKYADSNDIKPGLNMIELLVSPVDTGKVYLMGVRCAKLINWVLDTTMVTPKHVDTRASFILNRNQPGTQGTTDTIYVGTDGGLSRCTSDNYTFEDLNGNGLIITQFYAIAGARKIPNDIFGGTQDNNFYRYVANVWSNVSSGDFGNTVIDYQDPLYIFAMRWGGGITYISRSMDGGDNWDLTYNPTPGESYVYNRPLEMNPKNPRSLYTGGHNLYKSINRAEDFDSILVPANISVGEKIGSICVSPSDTNIIYIAFTNPKWTSSNTEKLIITINGGSSWESISDSLGILSRLGITDIEVSPQDPDSVWISFGGFDINWTNPDSIHNRVYFSDDRGFSWEDISPGLPDFPVNCIKYNPGSNGGIFAGTDVGVFYYDNDQSYWFPFNTGLPQTIVTDLEINDSVQLIKASTFGRGVYESDISCNYDEDPLVISSDTTWNIDTIMDRSILVDSSVIFTIECRVAFPPMAKIMVKCGGKLIVDGGTLTNACFRNWLGIEVWGNKYVNQSPVDNQGFVWLKNGAVLENSRIGITTCKKDSMGSILWNTTGGIIISDSATFQNNYKAIEFLSYRYRQISSFKQTTFQTTLNFIDAKYWYPSDFISLYEVSGVNFEGCVFQNTTIGNGISDRTKGQGIYSIEAQYNVDTYCTRKTTPCADTNQAPSTFSGLFYGIKALNYESGNNIRINKASFINNVRGTYLSACNNSVITSNTYSVPNHSNSVPYDTTYGLYMDACTGFSVEENIFRKTKNYQESNAIGLIVNNSGSEMNEIYNNRFDSLRYGILAQDQNRSSDGSTGLVLRCNDYHNNEYDKVIALSDTSQPWGIALYQGDSLSQTGPVGNTFSPEHNSTGAWDINNLGRRFKYYHHTEQAGDPRLEPDYYYNVTVRPTIWTYIHKDTCCPSNLSGGGAPPDELRQTLATENTIISQKENQLNALVDGGDTEVLNTEILTSTPPEALDIMDQLLNESPYLSDTAMQSAISKEDVLPNAMIRDILVANPQSATSDKVLDELDNRFIPMPDSMMYEILAGEEIISAKEALEAELTTHRNTRANALSNLIRHYRTDTINLSSHDSLITLLQTQTDLPLKYRLAFEYLRAGDTVNMDNTVSLIPYTYSLTPQQTITHNDYTSYFDFRKMLIKNGQNIFTIDSSGLLTVYDLFENGSEPVRSYARNILIARDEINYSEPILLPDGLKSSKKTNSHRTGTFNEKSYMKVFPNPARKYIIVEYNLKERYRKYCSGEIILTDIRGHQVLNKIISKSKDQEVINTSGVSEGTYICTLKFNGAILDTKKIVIIE